MRYVLIGIMLAAGAVYAQDTYRWTDKDGKVYYGANPPKGAIDPKKVANRVSSATAPGSGNKAVNTGATAAPKAKPFQTTVKPEENVRKAKEDSDKSPR
jgi:hypothetical protein